MNKKELGDKEEMKRKTRKNTEKTKEKRIKQRTLFLKEETKTEKQETKENKEKTALEGNPSPSLFSDSFRSFFCKSTRGRHNPL